MELLPAIFFFTLIAVLITLSHLWQKKKSEDLLNFWAEENSFQIISFERRHLLQGPFFLITSKAQVVYYVSIVDNSGKKRSAWIRFGGWFTGLFSDNLEVKWDEDV